MAWYAIYNTANGALESIGSSDEMPSIPNKTTLELVERPDLSAVMWDEVTRSFIARPAKVLIDRLNDIQTNPNFADFMTVYNGLNATNKTRLRNMIIRLLGNRRYRSQSESVEIE
jgi:hypothetical protein